MKDERKEGWLEEAMKDGWRKRWKKPKKERWKEEKKEGWKEGKMKGRKEGRVKRRKDERKEADVNADILWLSRNIK